MPGIESASGGRAAVGLSIIEIESVAGVERIAVYENPEYLRIGLAASLLKRGDYAIEVVIDRHALLTELVSYPGVIHHRVGVGESQQAIACAPQGVQSVKSFRRQTDEEGIEGILNHDVGGVILTFAPQEVEKLCGGDFAGLKVKKRSRLKPDRALQDG